MKAIFKTADGLMCVEEIPEDQVRNRIYRDLRQRLDSTFSEGLEAQGATFFSARTYEFKKRWEDFLIYEEVL